MMGRTPVWTRCAGATLLLLTACGGPTSPAATPSQPPITQTAAGATLSPDGECVVVEQIAPDSAEGRAIGAALLTALPANQPPELHALAPYAFDEIWSIDRQGNWIVVQASFKAALEPGIFVLESTSNGYRYQGLGWSGMAESAAAVRQSLAEQLPDEARSLAVCIDLNRWSVTMQPMEESLARS